MEISVRTSLKQDEKKYLKGQEGIHILFLLEMMNNEKCNIHVDKREENNKKFSSTQMGQSRSDLAQYDLGNKYSYTY